MLEYERILNEIVADKRMLLGVRTFCIIRTVKSMHSALLIEFFNPESIRQLKAGNTEQNDMKLKCYLRCFMMKSGILNKDNNIDVEKVLRYLPRSMQESSRRILNRCKSICKSFYCIQFLI